MLQNSHPRGKKSPLPLCLIHTAERRERKIERERKREYGEREEEKRKKGEERKEEEESICPTVGSEDEGDDLTGGVAAGGRKFKLAR